MQSDLLLIAYTTETGLVFLNLLPFSMPSIYSHLNIPKQDHQSTIVNFSTAGVWWWLGCLCLFFYLQSKQRWTRRRCTHLGSSSCSQPFNSIWSPAARHLILKSSSVNLLNVLWTVVELPVVVRKSNLQDWNMILKISRKSSARRQRNVKIYTTSW